MGALDQPPLTGELFHEVGVLSQTEADLTAENRSLTARVAALEARAAISADAASWAEKHAENAKDAQGMLVELRHALLMSCATGAAGVTIGAALGPLVSHLFARAFGVI